MVQVVKYEVLNPKCITMGELYGEFNPLTQEWHDGLASTIMRRAVADEGDHRRYPWWSKYMHKRTPFCACFSIIRITRYLRTDSITQNEKHRNIPTKVSVSRA